MFSDVWKHHSKEDGARLFVAGTPLSTPKESEMLAQWTKPYMFARVFGIGFVLLCMLYWMAVSYTALILPALFFIGSFLVPITMVLLFWELNIPRNIPMYSILMMCFVGGGFSLVITSILFILVGENREIPLVVGVVEEAAKLVAVLLFLRKDDKRYILNGLLIGAAVGAGFGAMETAGYAIIMGDWDLGTLMMRSFLAPGGHVTYAAITGGALASVKGREKLKLEHFLAPEFLFNFVAVVIIHAMWDSTALLERFYLFILQTDIGVFTGYHLVLVIILVLLAYNLLKKGLKQIVDTVVSQNRGSFTQAVYQDPAPAVIAGERDRVAPQNRTIPLDETTPQDKNMPRDKAAPAGAASCTIRGLAGEYAGKEISLRPGERILIGRDGTRANLIIRSSKHVSGLHCSIAFDGKRIRIKDLGSSNGTYVNGKRLEPDQEMAVTGMVSICLGNKDCAFQLSI